MGKIHYTEADFASDYRDEIDIRNSPSSPIEISDLHSYMMRKFPSLRNVKFTLRNKTSKQVIAIGVRIRDEELEGAIETGGPHRIEPKGTITFEMDDTAYGDFCEGVRKSEIAVTEVKFADGSQWQLGQPHESKK